MMMEEMYRILLNTDARECYMCGKTQGVRWPNTHGEPEIPLWLCIDCHEEYENVIYDNI
jgi:hypothetical protein